MLNQIKNIRELLHKKIGELPALGIIAGTGLGDLITEIKIRGRVNYSEIGFPRSTVAGHQGELVWGELKNRAVFILRGRFHLYEGYPPQEIALPIRALAASGMKKLIITNAAGGLDLQYRAGEIMLITDHINATGESPLIGEHHESWGERFPDMANVWDKNAGDILREFARAKNIKLHQGIYLGIKGAQLETPAETRMYKMWGAQAIGMSTVIEAIAAVQAGVKLCGISAITNVNNPDAQAVTSIAEIISAAEISAPTLRQFIATLAEKW